MASTNVIVVSFFPNDLGGAGSGGFWWKPLNAPGVLDWVAQTMTKELDEGQYAVTARTLVVPESDLQKVTDWLDNNIQLRELPTQGLSFLEAEG